MSTVLAQHRAMRSNARAWLVRKLQLATHYELGHSF
jgi:hypothetical protein